MNKSDLTERSQNSAEIAMLEKVHTVLHISAKTGEGLDILDTKVRQLYGSRRFACGWNVDYERASGRRVQNSG